MQKVKTHETRATYDLGSLDGFFTSGFCNPPTTLMLRLQSRACLDKKRKRQERQRKLLVRTQWCQYWHVKHGCREGRLQGHRYNYAPRNACVIVKCRIIINKRNGGILQPWSLPNVHHFISQACYTVRHGTCGRSRTSHPRWSRGGFGDDVSGLRFGGISLPVWVAPPMRSFQLDSWWRVWDVTGEIRKSKFER